MSVLLDLCSRNLCVTVLHACFCKVVFSCTLALIACCLHGTFALSRRTCCGRCPRGLSLWHTRVSLEKSRSAVETRLLFQSQTAVSLVSLCGDPGSGVPLSFLLSQRQSYQVKGSGCFKLFWSIHCQPVSRKAVPVSTASGGVCPGLWCFQVYGVVFR